MLVCLFGPINYISVEPLRPGKIAMIIFTGMFGTTIMVILAMLSTYVAVLRGRITNLMTENVNLFDKMSEGLIVLARDGMAP